MKFNGEPSQDANDVMLPPKADDMHESHGVFSWFQSNAQLISGYPSSLGKARVEFRPSFSTTACCTASNRPRQSSNPPSEQTEYLIAPLKILTYTYLGDLNFAYHGGL